jgi:hypothetical protein
MLALWLVLFLGASGFIVGGLTHFIGWETARVAG